MKNKKHLFLLLPLLTLMACGQDQTQPEKMPTEADSYYDRNKRSPELIKQGQQLYMHNCAVCHGSNAEGAPRWATRDAEGKLPPPPLNGSGHTWHHPMKGLLFVIENGTINQGGNMPAWKDKLSRQEMESIIYYLQSKWPDRIYEAWQRTDKKQRAK